MLHAALLSVSMSSYLRHIFSRLIGRSERRRRRSMSLGSDWSYSGDLGPENWHKNFPVAAGEHQSPINIDTYSVIYDPALGDIDFLGYGSSETQFKFLLKNTGYNVKIELRGEIQIKEDDKSFEAQSVVFHWGREDDRGSEHLLDMKTFPMEIQIMHRNVKYEDDEEVFYKLDGITNMGFFAEIGEEDHEGLKVITDQLQNIKHKGQAIEMPSFPLASILPTDTNKYYKYSGSLSSPPCNECVNWIIIHDPIKISKDQLNKFRSLQQKTETSTEQEALVDNFRPVQKIGRRTVTASLKLQDGFESSNIMV